MNDPFLDTEIRRGLMCHAVTGTGNNRTHYGRERSENRNREDIAFTDAKLARAINAVAIVTEPFPVECAGEPPLRRFVVEVEISQAGKVHALDRHVGAIMRITTGQ